MVGKSKFKVKPHLNKKEINELIKEHEISVKVLKRLYFIKQLLKGSNIKSASKFIGITEQTGHNWLKLYNDEGFEGLMPKYAGGRPGFLSDKQLKELDELIMSENNLSMKDVHDIIKNHFKVDYSMKQVGVITKKLGYTYTKVYPKFSKNVRGC